MEEFELQPSTFTLPKFPKTCQSVISQMPDARATKCGCIVALASQQAYGYNTFEPHSRVSYLSTPHLAKVFASISWCSRSVPG